MTIKIEQKDAARLAAIEKELRELEFKGVTLNRERNDILNANLERAGALPMEGDVQITSRPDWSEIIILKK